MQEFTITSSGGAALHCCKWVPEGAVKGVVQIIHGIAEYTARYDALALELNKAGYVVLGEDHMGHGGSINATFPQGCFRGGWMNAVKDVHTLFETAKKAYPDVPYFLYGHSMGSFLTRTFLHTYPEAELAGALISGTGWQPGLILKAGLFVCNSEAKKHGADSTSKTVNNLMFGSYTKGYENPRTPLDWLSRDEAVVDAYIADPLCGFDASIGLSRDMLTGMKINEKKKNLAKMNKKLPVYFFSGDMDPVGGNGAGVKKTVAAFKKAGMENVTLKLYPKGRHEMHNELNREELYRDVLDFLGAHS